MATKQAEHGTRARYRAGCGCAKCRKWKADDTAAYRARKAARDAGEAVPETPKPAPKTPRPTRVKRPTFGPTESEPPTARRPSSDDALAQLIEQALWDAAGDESTASVLAAEAIRSAGYRRIILGAIEEAARELLGEGKDAETRLRHEMVFRGARVLDDPEAGRNYKSTIEAMRQVLADLTKGGGAGDAFGEIVAALRGSSGSGDAPEVGDAA